MKKLAIAYFGSPDFSAFFLEKLLTDLLIKDLIKVNLVVTQPDRPVGRKQILTPTPVKIIAQKYGLKSVEIENWDLIKNWQLEIKNLDFCLLYAFGKKIPQQLLELPRYGFINIHPSLLPQYRGPSPIAYPLILGEQKTGVTIIKMDEEIDHGPIIAQESLTIEKTDKRPDLEKKLADLAFMMFKKLIISLIHQPVNSLTLKTQPHQLATYTRLLKKSDGFVSLTVLKKAINNQPLNIEELPKIIREYVEKYQKSLKQNEFALGQVNIKKQNDIEKFKIVKNSSKIVYDFFRGLFPWPGLWTVLPNSKRLKIINIKYDVSRFTFHVLRVQLEGKKETDFATFNRAYKIF